MNGYERSLAALDFRPTDRVPVVGGFVRHVPFLAGAAGVGEDQFRQAPRQHAIRAFRNLGVDVILALILPSPKSAIGAEVEHAKPQRFAGPEEMLPEIAALPPVEELARGFDFQAEYDAWLRAYREGQAAVGEDILWVPHGLNHTASFQNEGYFGAENYYMALALYPEAMERFFAHSGERARLRNIAVARAMVEHDLPRVMWTGQDACDNRGPYIAADRMQQLYLRHVQRSLGPLKEIGVKVLWHSDGNIMPIVPHLLAAGVDGFQGVQETVEVRIGMAELRACRTLAGRPPAIVGSVSTTSVMPFGTVDAVRADVRRCQALAAAGGGGWWLNFSSSVGPEVPEANIRAFYDEALSAG